MIVKIKKGLDIQLKGKPQSIIKQNISSQNYIIFPEDFPGFIPKVAVKQGDKVLAGTPVFFDKNHPDVKIVSPVSGEIIAVTRGEKRKLLNVTIKADEKIKYENFREIGVNGLAPEEIKQLLAKTGLFAFIRQRPYDIVANPADTPRDIFVSGFYSAPLAPDADFILNGQDEDFQKGLDVLASVTAGKVYLSIDKTAQAACLKNAKQVETLVFEGPHPAGNVGVQISYIKPVNKGETVWTIDLVAVAFIGRLFNKGITDFSRLVALTGSEVKPEDRAYYSCLPGVAVDEWLKNRLASEPEHLRFISGNVLTGKQISATGSLHFGDVQLTIIPEGDNTHEFMGWIDPGINKYSVNRSFSSTLFNFFRKKEYAIDARLQGGHRAMIMSEEWDKVFPMDILPEYLIRAIITFDIEKMENLGIYEVAPEDFALCEFVDTSKMELQKIVRQGLDLLYKEMN